MLRLRFPRADPAALCVAAVFAVAAASASAQGPSTSPEPPAIRSSGLRTFELAKPADLLTPPPARDFAIAPARTPAASQSLRTMIGVGYVQGADWGSELLAGGTFAGTQVQLNALVTSGRDGLLFDHGGLSVFDPDSRWRVEAGDVFSPLRGASLGGRVSWPARGNRRPALAVYGPRRGMPDRGTVLSYRDQIQVRGQTLLDAEAATDRSYLLRSRLTASRIEVEGFYRSQREPAAIRDTSVSGGVTLWRGVAVSGGVFESLQQAERSQWRMVSLRLPVSRVFDLTLERAFSGTAETSNTTSAAMASLVAGDLRLFHRYQQGDYGFVRGGLAGTLERQQTQSMTSYAPGPRLNLTLQLATQRTDTGQTQHWEELQTTIKMTSTTTLRAVTAVPDLRNRQRFQAYLRQDLPGRFALQADYGRISAFQSVARGLDRSRLKVMLFKTVDIHTPAGGAEVTGLVRDERGFGVAGARVQLGPYSVDTDTAGAYRFRHVPRGDYEVSLDRQLLPADFAWDGRGSRVAITSSRAVNADLRVSPLNAIHGRVYVDRNGNERFDSGEAVAGAVIRIGDRLTATDSEGAYSVYNLWPDAYVIRLQGVPAEYEAGLDQQTVTLPDGAPVTGADFRIRRRVKPIIWEGLPR